MNSRLCMIKILYIPDGRYLTYGYGNSSIDFRDCSLCYSYGYNPERYLIALLKIRSERIREEFEIIYD